jgi:hypothetical protein
MALEAERGGSLFLLIHESLKPSWSRTFALKKSSGKNAP